MYDRELCAWLVEEVVATPSSSSSSSSSTLPSYLHGALVKMKGKGLAGRLLHELGGGGHHLDLGNLQQGRVKLVQEQLVPVQTWGPERPSRTKQAKTKTTMVTETYYRKALAQMKNKNALLEEKHALLEEEHSQMKTKHALLEDEHAETKNKHTKLQEEYAELLNERNDLEGDTWLWMMQNNKLQAQHKELQAEHSRWKAACASLVKEVERKVLEEEYLAYLAQEYDQTHWPVAKVAELEVEQERQLAEAHELSKEREQALMAKVAALESEMVTLKTTSKSEVAALESEMVTLKTTSKSEVASLQSMIQQKDDDFDSFRRSSDEATAKLVKELAEATAEAVQHQELRRTLRTALEKGAKTAVATTNPVKERRFTKPVEVSAPTQQRTTLVVRAQTQQDQRPRLREKSSSCGIPSTMSSRASTKATATSATSKESVANPVEVRAQTLQDRMRKFELEKRQKVKSLQEQGRRLREKSNSYGSPSTASSRGSTKATTTSATLLKVPAQTLQRHGRKQELTKPKETKSVPSKATSRWEHNKNQRSGPSSAATSSTSSSPETSPRSSA
uniref:Uncharacterized protein n=1 Tax=Phytophthora ramorum TaxID=164328 RepID=H3GMW0_PHYRM